MAPCGAIDVRSLALSTPRRLPASMTPMRVPITPTEMTSTSDRPRVGDRGGGSVGGIRERRGGYSHRNRVAKMSRTTGRVGR